MNNDSNSGSWKMSTCFVKNCEKYCYLNVLINPISGTTFFDDNCVENNLAKIILFLLGNFKFNCVI